MPMPMPMPMLYCRANQLKSMMEKKMKALKPTKFLAFLTLIAFSSYSVASESVEVKLTYSPGQQAEYQNKTTGSVTMTGKQGASGSSNSRYRITATEVDKDGNLPIAVKILSSESVVNGKKNRYLDYLRQKRSNSRQAVNSSLRISQIKA